MYSVISSVMSEGRTSRLYRSLVRDQRIAVEAEGFAGFPGDKYRNLYAFYAVPAQGHSAEEMGKAIHAEIEKLKRDGVTPDELKMVKTRSKAALLRSLANNQGLAINLAENQMKYGDWREMFRRIDKMDAVTNEDVKRVANEVFVDTNRTVGILETGIGQGDTAMKRKILMAAMGAVLLLGSMQAQESERLAPPATNWRQIAIPPLPPFKPKEPTRVVLPNGMILFLTENHELPLISGSAMIRGGSDSEPADKTGLVELYGATWRTGGTEKLSGDQLDDYLEARAAKVETGGGDDDTSISFNCLKADFSDVLGIFADLLRHPGVPRGQAFAGQEGDGQRHLAPQR